ncbi:MAG: hypothetical protein ACLQDV_09065 [Candidatus Binataceae bacterium]
MKELDKKIVDLLIQPQNLDTAYDVAEQLPMVQDRLISKFWDTLEKEIQTKIAKREFEINREGKPTDAEAQIAIYEKRSESNWLQCGFKVEQEGGRLPVFFGISWTKEVSKDKFAALKSNAVVEPILSALVRSLEEAEFKWSPWWMGWKYVENGVGLRDRSMAIRLASGNDLEERVAAELSGLIEERLTPVHELNRALAKAKLS